MPIKRRVTISVSLPADTLTKIEKICDDAEISVSYYIRGAVDDQLHKDLERAAKTKK